MKGRGREGLARWALAIVVASALLGWEGLAGATGAPPPRLQIVLVGPPAVADLLAAAIAPLLPATTPVDWRRVTKDTVVATTSAPPPGPRIWIDGRSLGRIQIVALCRDAVPRVRTVEAAELTPVVAETVAQITRETAAALLAEAETSGPSSNEGGSPTRPAPLPAPPETVSSIAASDKVAAHPPRDLLFAGSLIVRDEYGLNAAVAYGGAISVVYSFRRVAAQSSASPFLGLSLGLFGQPEFGLAAEEIVETTGISWQPSPFLDLSVGLGGGIQRCRNLSHNPGQQPAGPRAWGSRLGAGLEQIISATLDVGQMPEVNGLWPAPNRIRPGAMIGIGWLPGR